MSVEFADLTRLIRPRRVAVVGASDRAGSMGYSTFNNVRNSAIEGGVYAINPGSSNIFGDKAYVRVSDVPGEPIDVAIVLVAAEAVMDVIKDCAQAGVGYLMVLSSGFSETGDLGMSLQAEMVAVARAAGMRIYGPNSPGLANISDRILLSMSPVAHEDTRSGQVGLVTQGGGVGRAIMQWMDRGLGIGLWSSPGNEADLDVADFINYMVDDEQIRIIGAVVEGFSSGMKFLEVARRARAAGKPIVLVKIGRSEYGRKTAASHTASIAGNDDVADAMFRQYGVIRVEDVDELAGTLHLFSRALSVERVDRVCVYSFSGGSASLGADHVGAAGLTLARFDPETAKALAARAPSFGFIDNPIDLTTKVFTDSELNRTVLSLVCEDPNVDSIIFVMPADYGESTLSVAADAVEIASRFGKLLIPVWMSPRHGAGFEVLENAGLAPFPSVRSAVEALKCVSGWMCSRLPVKPDHAEPLTTQPPVEMLQVATAMPPEATRPLLEKAGLRLPTEVFADTAQDARAAAETLTGPFVMKIVADGVTHKTEIGGVRLGLTTSDEVEDAFLEMTSPERLAPFRIQARGVSIQEMVPAGLDVLLGAHHDDVFGPVLTVGTGGVETEIERDVIHLSIPFTAADLQASLPRLRLWKRLQGVRGGAAVDLKALYSAIDSFAEIFESNSGWIQEMEINPLRVITGPRGSTFVALDVVVLPLME